MISFRNGDDDQELRAMMRKMGRYRAPDVLRARIRLAIRGSVAERATDIESPNHIEIRAWFAARTRPVPAVTRLDDLGYRLVGGRLDMLAGRRVAAVVYRRREHAVSGYSWVASSRDSTEVTADDVRGVQLLHWQRGTVVTCVASDLSAEEVRQFAALLRMAE